MLQPLPETSHTPLEPCTPRLALYAPSTPLSTSSTTQRQPVFVRPHQGRVEKHGASQGTFNKWKKKLTAFVVEEEVEIGTVAVEEAMDADLFAALVSWP